MMTMKKLHIYDIIVVEGKHDQARCKQLVDADFLMTNGTHVSVQLIELLKILNEKRGVIVFTDQDSPGNQIRQKIQHQIPNVKHAVLPPGQTKPGVEHADDHAIIEALSHAKPLIRQADQTLSKADYYSLGLMGSPQSKIKREVLSKKLHLPLANAKQMHNYLNMLALTKKEIESLL